MYIEIFLKVAFYMTKLPIIIDTDPGIDDAMMLTLAFANEDALDIRLVTTCSGNISQNKTNYNARTFLVILEQM